jgi:hypothetical protein
MKPRRMKRRLSLPIHVRTTPSERTDGPFNQYVAIASAQEGLLELPVWRKEVGHEAHVDVPQQRLGERAAPDPRHGLREGRRPGHCKVQNVAVDQRNHVVGLAHDAVCNVVRVQSLYARSGRSRRWRQTHRRMVGRCGVAGRLLGRRVLAFQRSHSRDDDVPWHGLYIALGYAEQLLEELVHAPELRDGAGEPQDAPAVKGGEG